MKRQVYHQEDSFMGFFIVLLISIAISLVIYKSYYDVVKVGDCFTRNGNVLVVTTIYKYGVSLKEFDTNYPEISELYRSYEVLESSYRQTDCTAKYYKNAE